MAISTVRWREGRGRNKWCKFVYQEREDPKLWWNEWAKWRSWGAGLGKSKTNQNKTNKQKK